MLRYGWGHKEDGGKKRNSPSYQKNLALNQNSFTYHLCSLLSFNVQHISVSNFITNEPKK